MVYSRRDLTSESHKGTEITIVKQMNVPFMVFLLLKKRQVAINDKIWTRVYGKIKHVWLLLTLPERFAIAILWGIITCTFG